MDEVEQVANSVKTEDQPEQQPQQQQQQEEQQHDDDAQNEDTTNKNQATNLNEAINDDANFASHYEIKTTNPSTTNAALEEEEESSITKSTVLLTDSQIYESSSYGLEKTEDKTEVFKPLDTLPEHIDQIEESTTTTIVAADDDDSHRDDVPTVGDELVSSFSATTEPFLTSQSTANPQELSTSQIMQDNYNNLIDSKYEEHHFQKANNESNKQVITSSSQEDIEKIVKDYEIPNFTAADNEEELKSHLEKNEEEETVQKESTKVLPERLLENEKYEPLLGNDSLMKKIIFYGDEKAGRPSIGQICTIDYQAFLKGTEELVEQEENFNFILGDGDVNTGMDMTVNLMFKNEKCELICQSRHAYGKSGKLPNIPPNTDLLYKIHLINFQDMEDLSTMIPIRRLSLAEEKKRRGNFQFNRQEFEMAINSYRKGLKYFTEDNMRSDEEDEDLLKFAEIRQALLMNLSLCHYKIQEYRMALTSLDELLLIKKNHVKALYIRGKTLMHLGETSDAIASLLKSLDLDPSNEEVKKELVKAQAKHKAQYEKEKQMYQKMISGVSEKSSPTSPKKNGDSKSQQKSDKNKKSSSSSAGLLTYVTSGFLIATASVGIALFAKYKNLI